MIKEFYRKIVPIECRYFIANMRGRKSEKKLLKELTEQYYKGEYDKSISEEIEYIVKKRKITVFPYDWQEQYNKNAINVYNDYETGMKYVLYKGKKLFFPKKYSARFIKNYFVSLLMEQDGRSPHCYFADFDLSKLEGSTFIDVGAAEGIISLDVIEKVKEVICFECNEEWKLALQKTFEPWKEKVHIVSRMVGNSNENNMISLDGWLSKKGDTTFPLILKLDVEGYEEDVIRGANKTIKEKTKALFVCTYHRKDDFHKLRKILGEYNFLQQESRGYMYYGNLSNRDFRKGLIRAWKREE